MPTELSRVFEQRLALATRRLAPIGEERSVEAVRPRGWLRKEILGHLLDSAAKNHQRFVRAALDGQYEGPSYEQDGWIFLDPFPILYSPLILRREHSQHSTQPRTQRGVPRALFPPAVFA